ncbi:acyl carrier protein [Saccharomonospora saliphila]|uniref:acyl carrier protein n=1 Tax=Saccharomonospora saliphila TaxID=369829 RepID=UPI000378DC49|nr:acyl carrier protein [Saccharomonospora saliphila]
MAQTDVRLEDLVRILRECAGEAENVDLDGDILDTDFQDLGYDSLALLEASSRISREYGVTLSDDAVTSAQTARELLRVVNGD